jgi:hypothetical protein
LAAAGNRIGCGEFGISKADTDVDQSGEKKCHIRSTGGGPEDQPETDEDVGPDVGVTP